MIRCRCRPRCRCCCRCRHCVFTLGNDQPSHLFIRLWCQFNVRGVEAFKKNYCREHCYAFRQYLFSLHFYTSIIFSFYSSLNRFVPINNIEHCIQFLVLNKQNYRVSTGVISKVSFCNCRTFFSFVIDPRFMGLMPSS